MEMIQARSEWSCPLRPLETGEGIPTLYTPRLILRPLVLEVVPVLHRIYQTEGVLEYFPNPTPPPVEKVEPFISSQKTHWKHNGYGNWAIVPIEAAEMIGWAGLQYLPETDEVEVGYLLDRPFWGKGYATEAAQASVNYGFTKFHFPEIIALVHPDNAASLRVAAKCGFTIVERKVYWGIEMVRHVIHPG